MREHHIEVAKTARFVTLGEPGEAAGVWFVLHGHGQLALPFIRHFLPLDDGTRFIVAPEALNRFYAEPASWRGAAEARVGATWMTREDRLAEIADYVGYLDRLLDHVTALIGRPVPATVLGFSQGVSTAARWICRGKVRPEAAILWAGTLPAELDFQSAEPLRATRLVRVLGDSDEMAGADVVASERRREAELGLSPRLVDYEGGHRIDGAVLSAMAARQR